MADDPGTQGRSIFRRRPRLVVAAAAVALVAGILVWRYFAVRESTDDAQIDGHVNGVAARVAGTVKTVAVEDNQAVEAGAVLVQIDPRDYEVAVARAQADLGQALADEKAAPSWRQDRAQAGHGAMGDMGVHVIDLIRWSFGEFTRVVVDPGVAYPARQAPGVNRPADADDHCSVLGVLASGAHVAFTVSRVAHATNDQSLEVWGTDGALRYRLTREGPRWFEGQLHASRGGADFQAVPPRWTPPPAVAEGDQSDVMGKALIAPLVGRMLHGIRTGESPSPSLVDGLRAQCVLDAVLESARRRAWVDVEA